VQNYEDCWDGVPRELMNSYVPTERDVLIVTERIADRLANPIAKQKKNGLQEDVRGNGESKA
jgi:hypothetical protein